MAKKKETRQLSLLEMKGLCKLFEDGDFKDEIINVDYGEPLTYIRVDEAEDGVSAYYGCYEDGPHWGVPTPVCVRRITVGGIKLRVEDCDEEIEVLKVTTPGLQLPDDPDLLNDLKDAISGNLESPDYATPEDQFEDEWSHERIVEKIERELSCDMYIWMGDTVYPIFQDVPTFLANYFSSEEEREDAVYTELTPHEAAEKLAEDICGE